MKKTSHIKKVTIIIPCRNEERHIEPCLDSLLANDYPKEALEIVIIDGMSSDRTREIVDEYCRKYQFIRMIDNPWHIKPKALNIGIENTESDVVMRIDAHAVYPDDYITKLVIGLEKYKADNIGGIRRTYHGDTLIENIISVLISHSFSVGNAFWRTESDKVKEVDTVFCGCYRRSIFDKLGLFNVNLIRTQDREFNYRLKAAGGKIILDPSIEIVYFPRSEIFDYLRWNFEGASWLFYANKFTNTKFYAWRNFIPLLFTFYLVSLIIIVFLLKRYILFSVIPLALYILTDLYYSVNCSIKFRKPFLIPLLFIFFPLNHISYGLGSIWGFIKKYI